MRKIDKKKKIIFKKTLYLCLYLLKYSVIEKRKKKKIDETTKIWM